MKNKEVSLLSAFEYEQWYTRPDFNEAQRTYYFDLSLEEKHFFDRKTRIQVKLYFVLQLGYFKHKQRLFQFNFDEVRQDIEHIYRRYFTKSQSKPDLTFPASDTIASTNNEILSLMGYSSDNNIELAEEQVSMLTSQLSCPKIIVRELYNYFSSKKIIFPPYTRLQKLIGSALAKEERRLSKIIISHITDIQILQLNNLFILKNNGAYEIQHLKNDPKNFSTKQLQQDIKKRDKYKSLYVFSLGLIPKLELSMKNIQYYASLVEYYNANELKEIKSERTHLFLICYMYYRLRVIHDHLIEGFKHYVVKYQKDGKEYAEKSVAKKAGSFPVLVGMEPSNYKGYNELTMNLTSWNYERIHPTF